MAYRTYLHVGTPKSGTAFLHGVLWHNADALRESGFLLPGRMVGQYASARAVTSHPADNGGAPETGDSSGTEPARTADEPTDIPGSPDSPDSPGSPDSPDDPDNPWSKIARQVNRWEGSGFIGHPQLASASSAQAALALRDLDHEVHLVITARPLQLQPALSWQDQVKGGLAAPFDAFLSGLRDDQARGRRFWRVHDVADLAKRWQAGRVAPDHVHIVPVHPLTNTATGAGDTPGPLDLWQRFAGALGLDPSAYDSDLAVTVAHLGPVELELLRRVHARRDPRFTDPQRHVWTRQLLANNVLARRPATPVRVPDDTIGWLTARSDLILSDLDAAGYTVAGDLGDLDRPGAEPGGRLMSDVTGEEVDEVAAWTILRLQEELVHREPVAAPPPVGPEDGVDGILDLLEHIRAADTGAAPRPAPEPDPSRVARIRRALPTRRPR